MMSKIDLEAISVFLKVVETGSFTGAARELGVAQSTASRRVSELERRLNQRLLERTSRRILLTEVGRRYADAIRHVLAGLTQVEAELAQTDAPIEGELRLSAPTGFGRSTLLPILGALAETYPALRLEIDLSDRYVDLLAEDYDLAIRMSEPEASGLEVMTLSPPVRSLLCAAPAYLDKHPLARIDDIADGHCLIHRTYAARMTWDIHRAGATLRLPLRPRLIANDIEALHRLTLSGLGVAMLPDYLARADLQSGRLVEPFPGAELPTRQLFMVWPTHKRKLPRLQLVRKFIIEALASAGHLA